MIMVNIGATSKSCKICHLEKPLTEFSKDSQLKSGTSNRCKACDKVKNTKQRPGKGFDWNDVKIIALTPEHDFQTIFGGGDIEVKGKLVMKAGKVLDEEWYQGKLRQLKKGRKD